MSAKTNHIYKKLWAIQNEVKKVVRSEKNEFQKYYFFNELQVLRLLKPLLEKYRVAIFLTDDNREPFFCEQKGTSYLVKYLKRLDIVDIEAENFGSNETKETDNENFRNAAENNSRLTYSFWAIGANQDPAKAKGAAETYAVKYMLTKFFLIPIKNINDPDYENKEMPSSEQQIAKEYLSKRGWYDKK